MTAAVAAAIAVIGNQTAGSQPFGSGPCCLHPNDVAAREDGRLGTKRFRSVALAQRCLCPIVGHLRLGPTHAVAQRPCSASELAIVAPFSYPVNY